MPENLTSWHCLKLHPVALAVVFPNAVVSVLHSHFLVGINISILLLKRMSGAEFVAVLSITASAIQIVEAGNKDPRDRQRLAP